MIVDETVAVLAVEDHPNDVEQRLGTYSLNDQAKKRLGLHLRAMYDTLVQQPVPDRFKDLIARLDDDASARAEKT